MSSPGNLPDSPGGSTGGLASLGCALLFVLFSLFVVQRDGTFFLTSPLLSFVRKSSWGGGLGVGVVCGGVLGFVDGGWVGGLSGILVGGLVGGMVGGLGGGLRGNQLGGGKPVGLVGRLDLGTEGGRV